MSGTIAGGGGGRLRPANGSTTTFQMPLHYPRYKKADYETMTEWKLDCLLKDYGIPLAGDVTQKRNFAIGAFLWPDQQQQ